MHDIFNMLLLASSRLCRLSSDRTVISLLPVELIIGAVAGEGNDK